MNRVLTLVFLASFLIACPASEDTPSDMSTSPTDMSPQDTTPDTSMDMSVDMPTGTTQDTSDLSRDMPQDDSGDVSEDMSSDTSPDLGPPSNPLDGISEVRELASGFSFTEGPLWVPSRNSFLFSDIPRSTIHEVTLDGNLSKWLRDSRKSNGLRLDAQNRVLVAEHAGRVVSRYDVDGQNREVIAANFNGDAFHSPNDIDIATDGTIYFTDPDYGLGDGDRVLNFLGVFRLTPDGTITAEYRDFLDEKPNGIRLSPDQKTLYVAFSESTAASVRAFDVGADGTLSNPRIFASGFFGADGMAVDVWGNLYVTSQQGVRVFHPDGTSYGTIASPGRPPSNCTFGGPDKRTLVMTARDKVFAVTLQVEGIL